MNDSASHSYPDVKVEINRAADDILDAAGAGDTGLRDALNLMVSATLHYLSHPGATLTAAIEAEYDTGPDEVLSWIGDAL